MSAVQIIKSLQRSLVFFIIFASPYLNAVECNSKSPELLAKGEKVYFDGFEPHDLSSTEERTLKKLIADLKGDWKGEMEQVTCIGSSNNTRIHNEPSEIKVSISENLHGALVLNIQKYLIKKKIKRFEKHDILLDSRLMVAASIEKSTAKGVAKFRRRIALGQSALIESIYDISRVGKKLIINEIRYLNGHFSEKILITLTEK